MSVEIQEFDMHHVYSKKEYIPRIVNQSHVVQIRTLTGRKICCCIYDNETLRDLYQKCYTALFNTANSLKVEYHRTIRDPIPNEKYQVIYDIVVIDKKQNMLSIPCDPNTMFCDFKRANDKYFIPSSKVPVLRVYKIYVVDNESMEIYERTQETKQTTVVDKMKRYLRCAF
jgi:hypothetical protein